MNKHEAKVKIGNYILSLCAVPMADSRWRGIYEVKATLLSGITIKGPIEMEETFPRAQEAIAAAHEAARKAVVRLPR